MQNPEAVTVSALTDAEFKHRIWLAMKRVYGELTYEPGEHSQLFRDHLPAEAIERLRRLIWMVRGMYPFPSRLFCSAGAEFGHAESLDALSRELEAYDACFASIQLEAQAGLCHLEEEACSETCSRASLDLGRVLLCRASLLEIQALIEMMKLLVASRARGEKKRRRGRKVA